MKGWHAAVVLWARGHSRLRARWLLPAALVIAACAPATPPTASERVAAPVAAGPLSGPAPVAGGQVAALADPGAPGPYAVGVTRRSLTRPSSTTGEPRTLQPWIWYPATPSVTARPPAEGIAVASDAAPDAAGRPYPLLLLSPGVGGLPDVHTFFATHLASHGFVVVGTTHPGTTPAPCPFRPCLVTNPEAREWLREANANRVGDARFTLDAVLGLDASDDPLFAGLVAPERVGTTGGSAGGVTALFLAADESRVRAAVALGPGGGPAGRDAALAAAPRVTVPVLIAAGEQDHLALFADQEALFAALAASRPERWFMSVARAGHGMLLDYCPDGWPGCDADGLPQPEAHRRINRWATAFLLRHVAGDERYAPLLDAALADSDPEIRLLVERAP